MEEPWKGLDCLRGGVMAEYRGYPKSRLDDEGEVDRGRGKLREGTRLAGEGGG